MLVAVGEVNVPQLINGFLAMAKDHNEVHENNRKNKGEFLHKDGWGAAWMEDGKFRVLKSTKPCYLDAKMEKLRKLQHRLSCFMRAKFPADRALWGTPIPCTPFLEKRNMCSAIMEH